ncbi:uncharacterized protein LOC144578207 [Callithrix jacchus]
MEGLMRCHPRPSGSPDPVPGTVSPCRVVLMSLTASLGRTGTSSAPLGAHPYPGSRPKRNQPCLNLTVPQSPPPVPSLWGLGGVRGPSRMCPVLGVKIEADSSEKRREDLASFSKHVLGILASFGLLWPFLYLSRSRAPVPAAGPVHRELQPFSQETHRKHPPSPCLTRKCEYPAGG